MQCKECNSNGLVKCKKCSGEGYRLGLQKCESCSGEGLVPCNECDGKGKIPFFKWLKSS